MSGTILHTPLVVDCETPASHISPREKFNARSIGIFKLQRYEVFHIERLRFQSLPSLRYRLPTCSYRLYLTLPQYPRSRRGKFHLAESLTRVTSRTIGPPYKLCPLWSRKLLGTWFSCVLDPPVRPEVIYIGSPDLRVEVYGIVVDRYESLKTFDCIDFVQTET